MQTIPLGGVITLLILLPNLLVVFFPPVTRLVLEQPNDQRLQTMTILERIGQVGCFAIPFFYSLNLEGAKDVAALAVMIVCMALYYTGWIRYLVSGRSEALFYRSLLGIPLPMAVMPVMYFLAAATLLGSPWLLLAAVLLGVGLLSVTWINARRLKPAANN